MTRPLLQLEERGGHTHPPGLSSCDSVIAVAIVDTKKLNWNTVWIQGARLDTATLLPCRVSSDKSVDYARAGAVTTVICRMASIHYTVSVWCTRVLYF